MIQASKLDNRLKNLTRRDIVPILFLRRLCQTSNLSVIATRLQRSN